MLTFEIKNGHAVVTGYEVSATAEQLSHVEIPARYKLFKVTEIGPKAFCGCTQIESIMLPDTINTIGDSAFLCSSLRWIGCGSRFEDKENGISCVAVQTIGKRAFCDTALEDIILQMPDNTLEVGEYAFADDRRLRNVVFQTGDCVTLGKGCFSKSGIQTAVLPRNGALKAVPEECFLGCVQLRTMSSRGVKCIGKNAFLGCKELRYLSSLDGLEEIGDSAFNLCCKLNEFTLPASCISFSANAFQSTGIEAFAVDPQNPLFCSVDGVIFSKDKAKLVSFPPARAGSYMIPDGTITIGEKAFYDSQLSDIGFSKSESLKVIEDNAFDGADNLVDVYLPDNVEKIGDGAFDHCHKLYSLSLPPIKFDWEEVLYGISLREVHFRGTEEEYKCLVTGELVNEPALFFLDTDGREYHHIAHKGKTLQFEYSILSGGGVRIDKVNPLFSKVIIPEMLDDDEYVVEISFGAFPAFTSEAFIPNTVREAHDAFALCEGALKHISIPFDLSIEPATIPKDCVVERRF